MNLSQVTVDLQVDTPEIAQDVKEHLQAEEARLIKIIESLREVQRSKSWSSLKTEVFDNLVNSLERSLREEARKDEPNTNKLNRISGELKWAERFSNLGKLENEYQVQLQNVRLKLYGKTD